jgi:hypothetical protein
MTSVFNSGHDFCTIQVNTTQGSNYQYPICVAFGTFTGFHRPFLDNEPLFDSENPQQFKDDYIRSLVIASGKVATDTKQIPEDERTIKYDKEVLII